MLRRLFARVINALTGNTNNEIEVNMAEFQRARTRLNAEIQQLRSLRTAMDRSFAQLKRDWDSEAGREFFRKFDNELLDNINKYANYLQDRSNDLNFVESQYQRVANAADAVANAQY